MITLLLLVRATYMYGVVLHAHPVRGESHNQRNTTGEVATKPYIELNTNLRSKAQNEFEKDFFKLMNSVFGKTMENIRNRVNIRLVNNQKPLKKCVAKPNFDHCTVFDENLVAVHMKKTELVFNKPV